MSSRWPASVSQITEPRSAFLESFTKLIAIFDAVETTKIFRVRFTRFHLEVDEDRPVFFQNVVELIVPIPQVREFVSLGIARRFGNGHETAQVHQQAPVAIEQNHAFVGTPER